MSCVIMPQAMTGQRCNSHGRFRRRRNKKRYGKTKPGENSSDFVSADKQRDQFCCLPDLVLIQVLDYLSTADIWAVAQSRVWGNLPGILRRRRSINLRKAYHLSPTSLTEMCNKYINSAVIEELDLSHCYWLSVTTLMPLIISMQKLTNLNIQGTTLKLSNLAAIFDRCQKLSRLALTIGLDSEMLMPSFQCEDLYEMEIVSALKEGFARITHLKVASTVEPKLGANWLLKLLHWSVNCQYLCVVVCCEFTTNGAYWNQDDLKSLACLPKLRALISNRKLTEETEVELLSLCGEMIEWLSFSNLDHLWLNDGDWDRGEYLPPRVESLYLFDTYDLDHKRFQQLKRIGWCELDKTVKFPNAIYVSGLVQNVEDMLDFVVLHPQLELLQVCWLEGDFKKPASAHKRGRLVQLPRLRHLLLSYAVLPRGCFVDLLKSCPNLEELDLSSTCGNLSEVINDLVLFPRLRKINLDGIRLGKNSNFSKLFSVCQRLESFRLSGCRLKPSSAVVLSLPTALPAAAKLRELRLTWCTCAANRGLGVAAILKALRMCRNLQRVFISELENIEDGADRPRLVRKGHPWLPQLVADVVSDLRQLVCLGLVLDVDDDTIQQTRQRFETEWRTLRPCLWFGIYSSIPRGLDVPYVHFSEMIIPECGICPEFW